MSAFGTDIDESCIRLFGKGATKREVLDTLTEAVAVRAGIPDLERFRQAIYQREDIMSTGIGEGLATPHVRYDGIQQPTLAVGLSEEGIDFQSQDNAPAYIIILFAMPVGADKKYLSLLAQTMRSLKRPELRSVLMACQTPAEVQAILNVKEA